MQLEMIREEKLKRKPEKRKRRSKAVKEELSGPDSEWEEASQNFKSVTFARFSRMKFLKK